MKKTALIFISLTLIFSFAFISRIISEDDPFAGMDTGVPEDPAAGAPADTGNMNDDPFAGMDNGAGADGGDMAASADVLFPDDPSGGTAPGLDGGGADVTPGGPEMPDSGGGTTDIFGNDTAPQDPSAGLDLPGDAAPALTDAPKPAVKSGPLTKKGVTKTNDIYTKSNYLGGIKHVRDLLKWGVKATSKLSAEHSVEMLNDNLVDTAWIEGKKDGGKKQAITFDFAEKYFIWLYEKSFQRVKISKILILNGFATDKATWKKYYRVKKLKVTKNGKLQFYVMLHDTMNWQTITLKKPMIIKPDDKVRAEIMDVFPEVRRENDTYVAITEFTFLGEPYGKKVEPKYIQPHLQGME